MTKLVYGYNLIYKNNINTYISYNNTFNVTFLSAAVLCLNSTKQQRLKMHLKAALGHTISATKEGSIYFGSN